MQLIGDVIFGPEIFDAANKLYPVPTPAPADLRVFASYALTDSLFQCPTRNATEALYVAQPYRRSPIYVYQYSHLLSSGPQLWSGNFSECWTNVCHGSDLPMWWHPLDPSIANFTDSEVVLSESMQFYWANFARYGTPGTGHPDHPFAWPAYNASTRMTLNFETAENGGITVLQGLKQDLCDFWDTTGYAFY